MTETPETEGLEPTPKVEEVEAGLDLLNEILGVAPKIYRRCQGDPEACGRACTEQTCPLRSNRLQDLGTMVTALLEEFRWHRAWAEELEALRIVPPGTLDRVTLRVEKARLQAKLKEALAASEALAGVQVLRERFIDSVAQIRAGIEAIEAELGGKPSGGNKA